MTRGGIVGTAVRSVVTASGRVSFSKVLLGFARPAATTGLIEAPGAASSARGVVSSHPKTEAALVSRPRTLASAPAALKSAVIHDLGAQQNFQRLGAAYT